MNSGGRNLWQFVSRRASVFFATAALVAIGTVAFLMVQPPRFTSTVSLLASPPTRSASAPAGDAKVSEPEAKDSFFQSQISLIKSPVIIGGVVDRFALTKEPAWNPYLSPPPDNLVRSLFFRSENKSEISQPTPEMVRASVIKRVTRAVEAERSGASEVIKISATSPRPAQAVEIANAISIAYREASLERQYMVPAPKGGDAAAVAQQTLAELEADLQQKEIALSALKARSIEASGNNASQASSPALPADPALTAAQAEWREKTAQLRRAQTLAASGASTTDLAAALNSDALRTLALQRQEVLSREMAAKLKDGENAPSVEKIHLELVWYESSIDAEVRRAVETLKSEVKTARARVASMGGLPSTQSNEGGADVSAAEQAAADARARFEQTLAAMPGASAQSSQALPMRDTPASVAEVSSASYPSQPSFPRFFPALGLGAALGLLAGLMMSLWVDAADDKPRRSDDVVRLLQRSPIAVVPLLEEAEFRQLPPRDRHPAGYLIEKPMSAFAEGLRMMRAGLIYTRRESPPKVIAITSAKYLEGKTAMALGLARVAAMAGQRVLLVDYAANRSGVCDLLGLQPIEPRIDAWRDDSWREAMVADTETLLDILTPARLSGSKKDSADQSNVGNLIQRLQTWYDLVIVDAPPLLTGGAGKLICSFADQTIVVVRARKTRSNSVKKAMKTLAVEGVSNPGLVLNFVDRKVQDDIFPQGAYQIG